MAVDSKKYLAENVLNERRTVCFGLYPSRFSVFLELSNMAGHLSVTESRSEGSQPCRQTVRVMVYQLST